VPFGGEFPQNFTKKELPPNLTVQKIPYIPYQIYQPASAGNLPIPAKLPVNRWDTTLQTSSLVWYYNTHIAIIVWRGRAWQKDERLLLWSHFPPSLSRLLLPMTSQLLPSLTPLVFFIFSGQILRHFPAVFLGLFLLASSLGRNELMLSVLFITVL
jgi:hypothetical protein